MDNLAIRHCTPCEGGVEPLSIDKVQTMLRQLDGWQLEPSGAAISHTYTFRDFYQTMAFVNALAWLAHKENHHPDLEVSFNNCTVRYSTHAIKGLSENDFICAARVNELLGS
jgi:4a-hydroxytetrahydrobiopterin dehydratase